MRLNPKIGVFAVLAIGLFTYSMNYRINHNEHMYLTAATLLREGALYGDFAFLQMPYIALLYRAIFDLTGTSHYLLWGRVITFGFGVYAAYAVFASSRRVSGNSWLALAGVILFCMSKNIRSSLDEVSNYMMPLAFMLFAYRLFVSSVSQPRAISRIGVLTCGVALSIAIGARLSFAALVPAFLTVACSYPAEVDWRTRALRLQLPLMLGLLAGIAPACFYFWNDPEAFAFNNLGYHLLAYPTGSHDGKFRYALETLFVSNAPIALALAAALAAAFKNSDLLRWTRRDRPPLPTALATLLLLTGILAAAAPTPSHTQYYSIPIPFLIITTAALYPLTQGRRKILGRVLVACVALSVAMGAPRSFAYVNRLFSPSEWEGSRIHDVSLEIRRALGKENAARKFATLSPLYAIESGLAVYPELSTGPFLFRVADQMTAAERNRYRATSRSTLHRLFDRDPPGAIYITDKKELEVPFLSYARQNAYLRVAGDFGGGSLWVRPPQPSNAPEQRARSGPRTP